MAAEAPLGPPAAHPRPPLADPIFVADAAGKSINTWWVAASHWSYGMMIQSAADVLTANHCHGRFESQEPRIAFNNQLIPGCAPTQRWERLHSASSHAADLLWAVDQGVLDADPTIAEQSRAAALFGGAAAHASLAFAWDQAFILTQPPTPTALPILQPYTAVRDSAMRLWDDLIVLTDGKTWQLSPDDLPLVAGPPTAARIHRIARTMAARTLVLNARTAAENATTDWTRVLAYADGGITGAGLDDFDFAVVDDGVRWYDYVKLYGNLHSWMRVDQRLINRMAPNIPARFGGLNAQPLPEPVDARLAIANLPCTPSTVLECTAGIDADYVYLGFVIGDAGRGVYLQSPFWHRRYVRASFTFPNAERIGEPLPHVLAAENDLMIAEALVRTGGDLTRAATLVNKTRVGRGNLPPVEATYVALLAAIEYERDVELVNTGAIGLFDRRRVDGLFPGQFRHLPVPGQELAALRLPIYTFGGAGLPDM